MKQFVSILLFILLIRGCYISTQQTYERYTEFPESYYLKAENIFLNTDTISFHYPIQIMVKGNITIIRDLHNVDYYLHAFSFPDWEHLVSFAPRGKKKDEIDICEKFQFNSLDSLWILETNKQYIHRYHLYPEEKKAVIVETIPLTPHLLRALDLIVTADGFIVPDYSGEYRYHRLDWKGNIISSHGFIPTEKKYTPNIALAQAWRPYIDYNEKSDQLGVVTQVGEVLEIYNLDDTTYLVKYGPHGEPLFEERKGKAILKGIMGLLDIHITSQYIYTIFDGISFKEIRDMYQSGNTPRRGGNQIYVFDLEGNPVKRFELDHYITGFDVHEDEGIIYAVDANQDEPVLKFTFTIE